MQFEGLRSRPTVKPQVMMNRKTLRNWELALGPFQVTMMLGLVMGSMVCAFALGYFSGRRNGFDLAREADLTTAMRLPIVESVDPESIKSDEIYAKLNDSSIEEISLEDVGVKDVAAQKLEPIKSIEEAPIVKADSASTEPVKSEKELIGSLVEKAAEDKAAKEKEAAEKLAKEEAVNSKSKAEEASKAKNTTKLVENKAPIAKEEPKKTEKIAEAPVTPPANLSSGWYAQVAAPRKKEEAIAIMAKLKASGFPAALETANVRGQAYYRVLVGPEKSAELSKRLVAQLTRESYVKGTPFVKQVR